MYQTQRNQRLFFSSTRKEIQKENRSKNIVQVIKRNQKILDRGYLKNELLHMAFRKRAIDKARKLKLID